MDRKQLTKRLVLTGIIAAMYTVLSLFLLPLSYGVIQCRISEILNLLAFINPVFAPGIILGCFVTNLFSPLPLDWLFGTIATCASMFMITRSKSLLAASLWPTLFCLIVGAELTIYAYLSGAPGAVAELLPEALASAELNMLVAFLAVSLFVMIGEFIAMTLIGVPVFRYLMKNNRLMRYLKGF